MHVTITHKQFDGTPINSLQTYYYAPSSNGPLIISVKLKGKVINVLNQAPGNAGVLGSGGIAPRIIDRGTRLR
jgi:hypothetical protein